MTTDPIDPYAVLGVLPSATADEITHAYRDLLRRHHPDTRPAIDPEHEAASDVTLANVIAAYGLLRSRARRETRAQRTTPPAGRATHGPLTWAGQPPIVAGPVHWVPPGRTAT